MNGKKIFLIVGALVVALGAAFGVNTLMRGSATPQSQAAAAEIDGTMVLVATRALPTGTIISPDMVRFQAWPKDLVEQFYFVKTGTDIQALVGTVVRNPITAGEPLTQGALVKPGDRGFLAAALTPGMRAITIRVEKENGVAGFVFPGDRVDLQLTQTLDVEGSQQKLYVTDTIIRNLRVLATDQRLTSKDADGKDVVALFEMVTLETTPKIAEKIQVSRTMGSLSLALRPLADDASEFERAVADGEIDIPEGLDAEGEKRLLARMANRPIDTGVTSTTGGEVSRYARQTRGFAIGVPSDPTSTSPAGAIARTGTAAAGAVGTAAVQMGPVVRVSRGGAVSTVPVGGN